MSKYIISKEADLRDRIAYWVLFVCGLWFFLQEVVIISYQRINNPEFEWQNKYFIGFGVSFALLFGAIQLAMYVRKRITKESEK